MKQVKNNLIILILLIFSYNNSNSQTCNVSFNVKLLMGSVMYTEMSDCCNPAVSFSNVGDQGANGTLYNFTSGGNLEFIVQMPTNHSTGVFTLVEFANGVVTKFYKTYLSTDNYIVQFFTQPVQTGGVINYSLYWGTQPY